jgi:hypothetical protein
MMQAFAYRHLVPAKEMKVAVLGRYASRPPVKILGETPVKIPAGGTARVHIATSTGASVGKLHLELSDPPDGIAIKNVSPSGGDTEIVLQCDAAKAKPGLKGNLIVNAFADAPELPGKTQGSQRRRPLGALPAIPFEVVAP